MLTQAPHLNPPFWGGRWEMKTFFWLVKPVCGTDLTHGMN